MNLSKKGRSVRVKPNTNLRSKADARASTLGIPRSVYKPVLDHFFSLVENSGEEWTIQKYKLLVSDFTQWLATGNRLPVPWVKSSSSQSWCYSGPIGNLERWCKTPDKKTRALQLLKIYTLLVSSHVTKSQRDKFVSAVQVADTGMADQLSCTYVPPYHRCQQDPLFSRFGSVVQSTFHSVDLPGIVGQSGSPSKRGPTPTGSYPEPMSLVDSVRFLGDFEDGFHIFCKYEDIFTRVIGPLLKSRICSDFGVGKREYGFHVGRIGLIQEPGYKLRAVANPGRVFQLALHKLGKALYAGLRTLPWDCTFEQTKAFQSIQEHLKRGDTAFCVDLRNATDFYPLAMQKRVLLECVPDSDSEFLKHVDLFTTISRSPWKMGDTHISWSVGQPLGLYPSFASFASSHGFLLYVLNGYKWDQDFYVLGDDVIILDDLLHKKYLDALNALGCPTSPEKSLTSSTVAEFAGNLIFTDKVVPLIKWKDISDDNFVDIARFLGPKSLSIFRSRQRRVLEKIQSFPSVGPGWNPLGIPLEERAAEEARFLSLADPVVPEPQTSRVPEAWRDLFSSYYFRGALQMFGKGIADSFLVEDDLDQRSRDLVADVFGSQFSDIHNIVAANALMVSGIAGFPCRARGVHHGRRTSLEILESKLSRLSSTA